MKNLFCLLVVFAMASYAEASDRHTKMFYMGDYKTVGIVRMGYQTFNTAKLTVTEDQMKYGQYQAGKFCRKIGYRDTRSIGDVETYCLQPSTKTNQCIVYQHIIDFKCM